MRRETKTGGRENEWSETNKMTINIILAGPRGQMGQEAIKMIMNEPKFKLVACVDRKKDRDAIKQNIREFDDSIQLFENVDECFKTVEADVFVDLTIPEVGYKHTESALKHNMKAVIGTSGFSNDQVNELSEIAKKTKTGCIIAPNFAIGAVLMMQFARIAAKYFPDVEIIEKHHDNKLDAPSGTAIKTAELIQEVREPKKQGNVNEYEIIEGARGGEFDGMRIHSMRLPGMIAHQEVVFGGNSEVLTVQHDSIHRESFMDGIKVAIESVMDLEELVYGLEHVLDFD